MNSALKPILPQPGNPQASGQASPAKGNVAGVNHGVAHPQGAQNSLQHPPAANNAVGQNLVHHALLIPPALPHAAPSMAPVSANMAQMAQNMSHHGNLSHVTQNTVPPPVAASPSKTATTSSPLSLVQDKVATASSVPLALTRTPEKKEESNSNQSNGTVESPKPVGNAPVPKPQTVEPSKDKPEVKPPPSAPKPAEKPPNVPNTPSTPQKIEAANAVGLADNPGQSKVATASEPPEKSPAKPAQPEPKSAPTADVAPSQSDSKPVPESAKDSQDKPAPTPKPASQSEPAKVEKPKAESPAKPKAESPAKPKVESPAKPEEPKVEKPAPAVAEVKKDTPKPVVVDGPKKEEPDQKLEIPEPKVEEKKADPPKAIPTKAEVKAKSTLKLATVNTPVRKRRQTSPTKASEGPTPAKKVAEGDATPESRNKRNRTQVQLYQSPTPELATAVKLSASAGRATPTKPNDDKLIVFYKNEYLAVRNAEGGFYVCQTMQNVYRNTRKIKIRWLSQDKAADPSGETYKPDFYDITDMETVLTTLSLTRAPSGGGSQILKPAEEARAKSILERAIKAEKGEKPANMDLTEEHPDGLDLSLYKDESQLEKKSRKRKASKSPRKSDAADTTSAPAPKRVVPTPKKSPRGAPKPRQAPPTPQTPPKAQNKRKPGSTPIAAAPSKTAVADKPTPKPVKVTPKRTPPVKASPKPPAKVEKPEPPAKSPAGKGRRAAAKELKPSPIVPTPSTSTGKTTRTPRKPPAKK